MKKTAIAALFAPSVVFLFVIVFFVGGHAGAHGVSHMNFGNSHCDEPTLTHHHTWGYYSLAAVEGGLQTTISAAEFAGASPIFSSFQVTQGVLQPGLNQVVASADLGFEAVHAYAGMTEIIDYYWNSLTGLGYEQQMIAFTSESMEYLFYSAEKQYRAVFTMEGEAVNVSFTPVATLVAGK